MSKPKTIPAGEFKARCLQLMEHVKDTHQSIIITKRNKPVAKLVPIETTPIDVFGCMKNSVTELDDITMPIDAHWEATDD